MSTLTTPSQPPPAGQPPPAAGAASGVPGGVSHRPRRLTGFKPTGHPHLGNLLGAIRPIVAAQAEAPPTVFVADLHALTVEHHPELVRTLTREQVGVLLAAGLDPDRSLLYVQSEVPQHTELHYLLECVASFGAARRMIQFREKAATQRHVRLSLLTYPVLMAADILLHDTHEVPVGADQTQHLELARDIAIRFNARYGETFVVPRAVNPAVAARVMDLVDPSAKMGKSSSTEAGAIAVLDPPEVVRRKVLRAVTDAGPGVLYHPPSRPGVANLLEILAAATGGQPAALAERYTSYGGLKADVIEALVALLAPLRARYDTYAADPAELDRLLRAGADRARSRAAVTVGRARHALGLR